MLAIIALLVLTGSFACTFAVMLGLQTLGRYRSPAVEGPRSPQPVLRRPSVRGPDDDPAFLRDLRRRIDLGHFRR